MSLAAGRLPIREDCCVLSLQQLFNVVLGDPIVDFLLRREFTADPIEAELTGAVIHHSFVVFECRGQTRLESTEHSNLGIAVTLVLQ